MPRIATATTSMAISAPPAARESALSRTAQTAAKSRITATLAPACSRPTRLARVPVGIASRSNEPAAAASRPPIRPTVMFQYATSPRKSGPPTVSTTSNSTAVTSSATGNMTSIGWTG